ncbi:MAG TPA: hypothetical protein VIG86_12330 [Candidatus Dormibacteraeota bacterium]
MAALRREEEAVVLVLAVLIPATVVGLIIWIAVGLRQRAAEPFSLASATAFYAHLMVIVTATAALCGGVLLVKAAFGFLNTSYSYGFQSFAGSSGPCPAGASADQCNPLVPQFDLTPQRTQDLVLGLTLVVVGVIVAFAHRALAQAVRGLPGGRPVWVERGSTVAFTVLYGFGALFGLIAAIYGVITYFVLPAASSSGQNGTFTIGSGGQPFGEVVGIAVVFIPAWVVAAIYLRRRLRASAPPLPPPLTAAAIP